jgi:hypothetical protein
MNTVRDNYLVDFLMVNLMKVTKLKWFSPLDCFTLETIIPDYLVYAFVL